MGNEIFAEENPAYAVLYKPDADNDWSARVVDLECGVVTGSRCRLTKEPDAYAVLYTPQPDGKWLAEIVDLPECKASRPEIAQARATAKDSAKKALASYAERGEAAPKPVTICYYTRPSDFQTHGGTEDTILEAVEEAVVKAVAQHRKDHGATPRSSSVCGYVTLSEDTSTDDSGAPE